MIKNIFTDKKVAEEYDNYYKSETGKTIDNIEKNLLAGHLENIPYRGLLELGCGTGHWTSFFCQKGFNVTAVDASENMLEIAEKKKNSGNCKFRRADATRLPFHDNSFSVVASVAMIEFIDDVHKVMEEIERVLKPGGALLLGCLNQNSELGKARANDPVFKHARFFTPEQIQNFLTRFGEPELSYGVYFSPDFELMDGTPKQNQAEPVFIAASVKKTK